MYDYSRYSNFREQYQTMQLRIERICVTNYIYAAYIAKRSTKLRTRENATFRQIMKIGIHEFR